MADKKIPSAVSTGSCIKAFALLPAYRALLDHYLAEHAPYIPTNEPVTIPRNIFDILCMAALAGLEAAEIEDARNNNQGTK